MSEHKFAVGQIVEFSPGWSDKSLRGPYTIVRLFPKVGNSLQYRIRSKRDGHERMTSEEQLVKSSGTARVVKLFAPRGGEKSS